MWGDAWCNWAQCMMVAGSMRLDMVQQVGTAQWQGTVFRDSCVPVANCSMSWWQFCVVWQLVSA